MNDYKRVKIARLLYKVAKDKNESGGPTALGTLLKSLGLVAAGDTVGRITGVASSGDILRSKAFQRELGDLQRKAFFKEVGGPGRSGMDTARLMAAGYSEGDIAGNQLRKMFRAAKNVKPNSAIGAFRHGNRVGGRVGRIGGYLASVPLIINYLKSKSSQK